MAFGLFTWKCLTLCGLWLSVSARDTRLTRSLQTEGWVDRRIIGCASGARSGFTDTTKFDQIAACAVSTNPPVPKESKLNSDEAQAICAPGWHVCDPTNTKDKEILRSVKTSDALAFDGCFVYNGAQDQDSCGACSSKDDGDDVAGAGRGCGACSNVLDGDHKTGDREGQGCFDGKRIDALQNAGKCVWQGCFTGVVCCKDKSDACPVGWRRENQLWCSKGDQRCHLKPTVFAEVPCLSATFTAMKPEVCPAGWLKYSVGDLPYCCACGSCPDAPEPAQGNEATSFQLCRYAEDGWDPSVQSCEPAPRAGCPSGYQPYPCFTGFCCKTESCSKKYTVENLATDYCVLDADSQFMNGQKLNVPVCQAGSSGSAQSGNDSTGGGSNGSSAGEAEDGAAESQSTDDPDEQVENHVVVDLHLDGK